MLAKSIKRSETPLFKDIDCLIKQNKSFAFYRLPNQQEPILIIGNKNHVVNSVRELKDLKGFIIAPFQTTTSKPIICIEPENVISGYDNINRFLEDAKPESNSSIVRSADEHYESYKHSFAMFLKALENKEFEKIVLSRPSDFTVEPTISCTSILSRALESYPSSFVYLCHTPHTGTWMGASPELLLEGSDGVWGTVALAGTQQKSEKYTDYNWDSKNTEEQLIVSRYIKQILDDNHIGYVEEAPITIESGDLVHLKTTFSFSLNDAHQALGLIEQLHPTPAICGLPKEKAYRYILDNEGYDRAYYSGFIGYLDTEQDTNLYVNLRCMKIEESTLKLFAGGGLLPSSDFESEWNETQAKMQTMLSLLK